MFNKRRFIIATSLLPFLSATLWSNPSADEMVRRADNFRGSTKPFSFFIKNVNYKSDKISGENILKVHVYDGDRSLVLFLKPTKNRGRKILMVKENLWIFIPTSKRPIRITPQQKLLGQVSNGDVARTNYYGDYSASILGSEKIQGKNCYKLELIKKNTSATYHKIHYFLTKKNYTPIKAVFFTKSGKQMKTALFSDFKSAMDHVRVHKVEIRNALHKDKKTIMYYSRYSPSSLPKSRYQRSQLTR